MSITWQQKDQVTLSSNRWSFVFWAVVWETTLQAMCSMKTLQWHNAWCTLLEPSKGVPDHAGVLVREWPATNMLYSAAEEGALCNTWIWAGQTHSTIWQLPGYKVFHKYQEIRPVRELNGDTCFT